ncbi:MAG TPA: BTAD domain-containing putative transcriptional regulator, partial [Actinophytocola sp.]|uniref:AfsR/SARP family transcriptional regulator n=1 Tax=Actinophytocola sp. TaxID=1872138 RepID=UPI002DF7E90E|nr:BTAD domain-containing putative transcriptional regulator [Actinophytocola sp.]
MGAGVDIRLLGPVEVTGPAGPAELVGVRQRALVALLALNAGSVVARARLIDALWGEDPPRTAVRTLQSHVTRVRQALRTCGSGDVLLAREPGYLLAVGRDRVDALRFEDAVRLARTEPGAAPDRLRAALGLWRAEVGIAGVVDGWAAREVERLTELRVSALEDLWAGELDRGGHATAVDELERLLATWPGRERLVGLHMLALYRCGRVADALERYERLRARLADELGADPGPRLRALHTAILRHDPGLEPAIEPARPVPAAPVPAQLPPPAGHFSGRAAELTGLARATEPVLLIRGTGGAGKTALAVRWAHQARNRFPDGQLFVDLRGHDPDTALTPAAVLTHALRGLGVPGDRVPAEVPDQTALYRTLVHDKRILVVLDNAGTADHVLPLVPTGPGSRLLVTSRRQLAALAVHHAVHAVDLGMLSAPEALDLVGRILGPERVDREAGAAAELADLCDRLPLALRIAAAKLAARPHRPVADLVAELSGPDRLDTLALDGESPGVRAVFASAYQSLSEPAARLLRLLGPHPGTSFTTHLAATLAGVPFGSARRSVDELAAAHLITDKGANRHRFHDLIRLYAAERAHAEEPPDSTAAAQTRLLDWYLAITHAANAILDPARDRVTLESDVDIPFPANRPAALAFLDAEHTNLMAVLHHADDPVAWRMCYLLAGYFESRGHHRDRILAYHHGLAAAIRLGDPATEALMRSGLGIAHFAARSYEQGLEHFGVALTLARVSGDQRGEGHVRSNISATLGRLRRYDEAIEVAEHALAVHTANGHQHGITLVLSNIGCLHARAGRLEPALEHLTRGLSLARKEHDIRLEAGILLNLGEAYRRAGNHDCAMHYLTAALALLRQQGDRCTEASTLSEIGLTHLGAGDPVAARD